MTDDDRRVGRVAALAVRASKEVSPELRESLDLDPTGGVAGDHATSRKRQVTLLSSIAWKNAVAELGHDVEWTARRANILVDDLDFDASSGYSVRIGEVIIEILGETVPCDLMDQHTEGLREALVPDRRGGVYGRVVSGGRIQIGDAVERPSRTPNVESSDS